MCRSLTLTTVALLVCSTSGLVTANDARSIALGGSVIANGKGVHGAIENPASLMAMKRRGETTHLRFGFSSEVRDTGDAINTFTSSENEDLISDIETELDNLSNEPVTCDPRPEPVGSSGDTPCISNTQSLSDLMGRLLNIMDQIDDESIDAYGAADLGMAYTKGHIPFAVNVRVSGSGSGTPDVAEGDRTYISEFNRVLDGNTLTLDEARDTSTQFIDVDSFGNPLRVVQPEDVLDTTGDGSALMRTQLGISLATTMMIGDIEFDLGVTPKLSSLTAGSLNIDVGDEFQEDSQSAADRFMDSEVTESSFTVDVGGSVKLQRYPVQIATVIRNLIPESIKTIEGFEFETTPQLIIGAAYQLGMVSLTGDIALNEAKQDNFKSQKMALGAEFATRLMAIRGGISHDASRRLDSTSLSLGFGLGPLELGGRLTGSKSLELGAQLAYSFK